VITEIDERWSGNGWLNSFRSTYYYDNSSNLLTYLLEDWSNNAWVNLKKDSCVYDNNGNGIHGECFYWQSATWVQSRDAIQISYNHHRDSLYFSSVGVFDIEYTLITGISKEDPYLASFNLRQNYPNPFNPSTTINYSLAKPGNVKLTVYNSIGSKVATIVNEYKPAGNYSVQFNGSNLASGIYLYRLESGNYSTAKKFILMK
jgi:hypothetical protein